MMKDKTAKKEAATARQDQLAVYREQINAFLLSETDQMISFPTSLTNIDRKVLHLYAMQFGLKSKSIGNG